MNIAFVIKFNHGYWGYSSKPLPFFRAHLFETVSSAAKKIGKLKQSNPKMERAEIITVTTI